MLDRPELVKGAASRWPAVAGWSPTFLSEKLGDMKVSVIATDDGAIRWNPDGSAKYPMRQSNIEDIKLKDATKLILDGDDRGWKYRLSGIIIVDRVPSLLSDLRLPWSPDSAETNLWFSSAGLSIPLHYDTPENIFVQIYGRKRFTIFSPDQGDLLYENPPGTKMCNLSQVDLTFPDRMMFPKFREAKSVEVILEPGDVLMLPARWWHFVLSETVSISVNQWLDL